MSWDRIVDWDRIAADLTMDEGALLDILILDTSLEDWQRVLDAVRDWTPAPALTLGGEPMDLPERVEEIFRRSQDQDESALLSLVVGGGAFNCHFFWEGEIEFDLDPKEVTEPAHLDALISFMSLLGDTTGKPVLLTVASSPDGVMFRYSPDTRKLEWRKFEWVTLEIWSMSALGGKRT